MHEVALMNNLLSIVEKAACDCREPVRVIHLRIGSMAGINREALQFAFEVLAPGSAAEGARLEMETVPLKIHCSFCGQEAIPEEPVFICKKCGSTKVEILAGREMEIDYILVGDSTCDDTGEAGVS